MTKCTRSAEKVEDGEYRVTEIKLKSDIKIVIWNTNIEELTFSKCLKIMWMIQSPWNCVWLELTGRGIAERTCVKLHNTVDNLLIFPALSVLCL